MARIKSLFEHSQGKLGALVFYQVGDEVFVRTRAQQFRDRKSPAQLAQRQRLQVMNSFLKSFRDLLSRTFTAGETGKAGFQAAKSYNMRNALSGEYPHIAVDMGKVLLSRGPLSVPLQATAQAHPEGVLIEWENGFGNGCGAANDALVVVAYFSNSGRSQYRFTETYRSEGRYLWKLPLQDGGDANPDIWIAFRNPQETLMSNSLYAGSCM